MSWKKQGLRNSFSRVFVNLIMFYFKRIFYFLGKLIDIFLCIPQNISHPKCKVSYVIFYTTMESRIAFEIFLLNVFWYKDLEKDFAWFLFPKSLSSCFSIILYSLSFLNWFDMIPLRYNHFPYGLCLFLIQFIFCWFLSNEIIYI